ncbi:WD40-repeat-containing domain protein [Blakeslea trispora]|nr:WD40-repeat-containing domain protein [Blakeslea trispora]
MRFEEVETILAGPDGPTVVAYKPNAKEVVFAGPSGTGYKVYEIDQYGQEHTAAAIKDQNDLFVTCVAVSKTGAVAVGSIDGLVVLYNQNDTFEKILVRSTVPVRHISFHPSGTKVAIATDDNIIRIVLTADNSKIVQLEGHTSPVKTVVYNNRGDRLISTDTNGDIRIWDISNTASVPECIKTFHNCIYDTPPDSFAHTTTVWHPDNSCFAFPGKDREIRVFKVGLWSPFYTLQGEHTQNVLAIAWSPNGYYIASAAEDNSVVIWDTQTKKAVRSEIVATPVTSMSWSPSENELALSDGYGQLRIWKDVIPTDNSNYPHPAHIRSTPSSVSKPQTTKKLSQRPARASESQISYAGKSLEVDDETAEVNDENDDDDDLGDDVDMDDEEDEGEELMDEGEDLGDFVIDDDGAGYTEQPNQTTPSHHASVRIDSRMATVIEKQRRKLKAVLEPPTSFQPGETPYHKPEDGKLFEPQPGERRYMAYNLTGAITTIFEGNHSVINVEFHDQTEFRNFHFTDMRNFSVGALSASGTVFAAEGKEAPKKRKTEEEEEDEDEDDEDKNQNTLSTLYYRPHTLGSDKDWTHFMLPGEDIVNIAINRISVIATTSLGYVRIFSISGVQRHLFSLENVVCVSAMTDMALIVYASGPSFENQHNLHYILLNTDSFEVLQRDQIQLSTDSQLNWIGFSETNQAATYDSAGILRLLHRQRRPYQATWVPVFHSKAYAGDRTERYWPVGVLRDRFVCVVLRGQNMYPFFPRPPVKDVPLQLPFLDLESEVGTLEESVVRTHVCTLHERDEAEATNALDEFNETFSEADVQMDVALLKLINLACKSERVSKALDLTDLLHTEDSVDKAIRIASHHRYTHLAEKMSQLRASKFMGVAEFQKEPSLADSFRSIPNLHSSNQTALNNDLAGLKQMDSPKTFKRNNTFDMEDDESHLDTQTPKRAKGFTFSTR